MGKGKTVCATLVLGNALLGCAPRAALDPSRVAPQSGAAFGRIQVFKGELDKTGSCNAYFENDAGQRTGVSLDDSGWVFFELPRGKVRLESIVCLVWNGLSSYPGAEFDVRGDGTATYFGHVTVHSSDDDAAIAASIAASVTVNTLTGMPTTNYIGLPNVELDAKANYTTWHNRSSIAIAEYRQRYHSLPRVEVATAIQGPVVEPEWRRNRVSARVDLEQGITLRWLGLVSSQKWLGFQFEGSVEQPRLPGCKELLLNADKHRFRFPLTYRTKVEYGVKTELARVKLDVPTFEAITNAGDVRLGLCGSEMLLTKQQAAAGKKLLAAYQERLTTREREQIEARASAAMSATSADPTTTEKPSASEPASAEVPQTTADAPTPQSVEPANQPQEHSTTPP